MTFSYLNINHSSAMIFLVACALLLQSCEEFLTIPSPKTQITAENLFKDEATATAAVDGIYSRMSQSGFASGDVSSISYLVSLTSDELITYYISGEAYQFERNEIMPTNSILSVSLWEGIYQVVYTSNSIIEGLEKSTEISEETKKRLLGEVKFVRAFCYFYLVNLFGDVPLHLSTDAKITSVAKRSPTSSVYVQLLSDLLEASELLDDSYRSEERITPSKSVVNALLARIYLYLEDWENAEGYATKVIESGTYDLEGNVQDVFVQGSSEAIWQLKPVTPDYNTNEGKSFILYYSPEFYGVGVSMRDTFLNIFNEEDNRKDFWIGNYSDETGSFYYPFKYKIYESGLPVSEYSVIFRLAEQVLIRSEARAKQGKNSESIADLDLIRSRAGIPLIKDTNPAITSDELLSEIVDERRKELFAEWGHRWFDLKRWNIIDQTLSQSKDSQWTTTDALLPIPMSEILSNPNINQNSGY